MHGLYETKETKVKVKMKVGHMAGNGTPAVLNTDPDKKAPKNSSREQWQTECDANLFSILSTVSYSDGSRLHTAGLHVCYWVAIGAVSCAAGRSSLSTFIFSRQGPRICCKLCCKLNFCNSYFPDSAAFTVKPPFVRCVSASFVYSADFIIFLVFICFFMIPDGFCVAKCRLYVPEGSGQWRYN